MEFNLDTTRLNLRQLDSDDAEFIYRLVNDSDWIRFIGDRNVADPEQARAYIEAGPGTMYREHGFGLYRVGLKPDDIPVGICGLLKRDNLPCPDLGFALLPDFRQQGFALEAAHAVLQDGFARFDMDKIAAILNPANTASAGLLDKLGFQLQRKIRMEPNQPLVDLYLVERGT